MTQAITTITNHLGAAAGASILGALLGGCAAKPLPHPTTLASPYTQPVVIAVTPALNDAGVSIADGAAFADELVGALQVVEGVTALSVNRTLAAMNALEMDAVRTPQDASALARRLDADAVLVTTLDAWEPYEPLRIAASGVLYAHTDAARAAAPAVINPELIQTAWSDESFIHSPRTTAPVAAVALHLDAADNDVKQAVNRYAEGRHDPATALGWTRYLKSMRDYQRFAAFSLVEAVLLAERRRTAAWRPADGVGRASAVARQAEVAP